MSPRALTEEEKCRICNRLLEKGKELVLFHGIKKVSVDEIAKAAGVAKGTFYQHFGSKEEYLLELIEANERQVFSRAEQMIHAGGDLRTNLRSFLINLYNMPELAFLVKNFRDLSELFQSVPDSELQPAKQREADIIGRLLTVAGVGIQKVTPGVVHNYIHALFLMMCSDLMIEEDLQETFECIMDSLVNYIFGGAQ